MSRAPVTRTALPAVGRLEDVIGGREARIATDRYWHVLTDFDAVVANCAQRLCAAVAPVAADPRHTIAVDIETGGFAGMPVFLIGVVLLDEQPLRVHQLLARDYPEEGAILAAFAELATGRDTWVSFNGKSFDGPFLCDRAVVHGVRVPDAANHIDVLHLARRRWRRELPDCRLGTLEARVLRRPRVGDVPSSDVPGLFNHFINTGNARPLRPVLEHNRIDLVSTVELFGMLSGAEMSGGKQTDH